MSRVDIERSSRLRASSDVLLLRPHRHAGRAAHHFIAVREPHEDPVGGGIEGDVGRSLDEIPNVGVALESNWVVTLLPIDETHTPVVGFVSQSIRRTGRLALPVSADAVLARRRLRSPLPRRRLRYRARPGS